MNPTDPAAIPDPAPAGPYQATAPRSSPPAWTERPEDAKKEPFPTGAKPTPPAVLRAANKATFAGAAPDDFAVVPARLDYWGNDRYGVCVTSEEAFGEACYTPEVFIPAEVVIDWARRHNVLNGATLEEVLVAMLDDGFQIGAQRYNNGPAVLVDYRNEEQLKIALTKGPVKIAIDSRALPGAAGNVQGWYKTGGRPNQFRSTDHCVSLSGYGSAEYLFRALGVALPASLPAATRGYLLFTWSTLGFVDHAWLLSTCVEAWLREPTTVGVPPLPGPTPVPPSPPTPPTPGVLTLDGWVELLGQKLPAHLSGPFVASVTTPGAPNFMLILADVLAIMVAVRTRDVAALVAAVQKLIADLGLTISPEERDTVVQGITQALSR